MLFWALPARLSPAPSRIFPVHNMELYQCSWVLSSVQSVPFALTLRNPTLRRVFLHEDSKWENKLWLRAVHPANWHSPRGHPPMDKFESSMSVFPSLVYLISAASAAEWNPGTNVAGNIFLLLLWVGVILIHVCEIASHFLAEQTKCTRFYERFRYSCVNKYMKTYELRIYLGRKR